MLEDQRRKIIARKKYIDELYSMYENGEISGDKFILKATEVYESLDEFSFVVLRKIK